MEMRIRIAGVGVALPKLSFGLNLLSGVYFELRHSAKSPSHVFGVAATPDISGKNGTLFGSFISTKWTIVQGATHAWICDRHKFVGKIADVEIKGTLIVSDKVDLTFKIYDANGESEFTLEQIELEGEGFQITDTKIRGRVLDMMASNLRGLQYCE